MTTQTEIEFIAWHPTGFKQAFIVQANQSVLIGKSVNCGVRLNGHDLADIHCSLGFAEGKIWVQDWMSTTGTKVNGELINARTYFGQGCLVELGSYKIQLAKSDKSLSAPQPKGEQEPQEAAPPPVADRPDPTPPRTSAPGGNAAPHSHVTHSHVTQPQLEAGKSDSAFAWECHADDVYDRETVELLLAEIEDLRAALAASDAQHSSPPHVTQPTSVGLDESDQVLQRIQELSEEANRAEERVLVLEEMLHAAEDANRFEVEERSHLEAWVGDIEKRLGQRESEHAAELEALRERLQQSDKHNERLQQHLRQATSHDECQSQPNTDSLGELQQENRCLQEALAEVTKDLRLLKQKFENQAEHSDVALREERAKIAREHAEVSRMKFEYAQKIQELEELPKPMAPAEPGLQGLREHRQYLREMSKEKKDREVSISLAGRLKRIWSSME
jgi:hypothetical protein